MSNKASSHLFDLIKSLTKSEKRYFKLFASRHTIGEENSYIRLFDFIDRMDSYQEDLIFMHFRGQAFLNKFSITKSRLYDNVLKSLDAFHAASSIDAQIYRSIHNAEILFNKGLYSQSEKLLRSAEKQAEKHECLNLLLTIKQKQKQLIETEQYSTTQKTAIEALYKEEKAIVEKINNGAELWKVKSLLFLEINVRNKARTEVFAKKLKAIISELKTFNNTFNTLHNTYLYHHTKSAYYYVINDMENSYHHLKENIQHLLKSKYFKADNPNIIFSLLTNAVYVSTRLKHFTEAQNYLEKLKALAEKEGKQTEDLSVKYFSSTSSLELSLLMEKGEFDKAEKLVTEIQEGLRIHDEQIPVIRRAVLNYQCAVLYLTIGEFNQSLSFLNKILNDSEISQEQEIYGFAQMLTLIVHVELNNDRFLPYAYSSTKRFIKKHHKNTAFDTLFLKIINEMIKVQNKFDLQENLVKYKDELATILSDKHEQTATEYFDFYTWVESKILDKPYLELKLQRLNEVA